MINASSQTDPAPPVDPDVCADEAHADQGRPVHLRLSLLLLVFAGGTLGTAARAALALAIPELHRIPVATLACNITGALLLGVLLELLARSGPDEGRRRALRLFAGTGFLGGYTTYSAFAVETATLVTDGSAALALGYSLGTVVVGAAASCAGIALGALVHRRRGAET